LFSKLQDEKKNEKMLMPEFLGDVNEAQIKLEWIPLYYVKSDRINWIIRKQRMKKSKKSCKSCQRKRRYNRIHSLFLVTGVYIFSGISIF